MYRPQPALYAAGDYYRMVVSRAWRRWAGQDRDSWHTADNPVHAIQQLLTPAAEQCVQIVRPTMERYSLQQYILLPLVPLRLAALTDVHHQVSKRQFPCDAVKSAWRFSIQVPAVRFRHPAQKVERHSIVHCISRF